MKTMNKQSPRDHIESRYSTTQIRQMYALSRAGKGRRDNYHDLPTTFRREAGQVEINAAVAYVAERWPQFNR